jgi:hypothetical protein
MQGGVVQFPLKFASGIMRGALQPRGRAALRLRPPRLAVGERRDGVLNRVRYTGKPLRTLLEMKVSKDAIALTFTDPLDPEIAADTDSYAVQQWKLPLVREVRLAGPLGRRPEEEGPRPRWS